VYQIHIFAMDIPCGFKSQIHFRLLPGIYFDAIFLDPYMWICNRWTRIFR
jgi:hypothetical protein